MPRRFREKTIKFYRRTSRSENPQFSSTFSSKVQLKEGQDIYVLIDDMGSKGEGISRAGRFPIIVPKLKVGERLKVKIHKVDKKFAIAERIEWEEK